MSISSVDSFAVQSGGFLNIFSSPFWFRKLALNGINFLHLGVGISAFLGGFYHIGGY